MLAFPVVDPTPRMILVQRRQLLNSTARGLELEGTEYGRSAGFHILRGRPISIGYSHASEEVEQFYSRLEGENDYRSNKWIKQA